MDELKNLLDQASTDLKPWILGKIPKHFKRITVDEKKALELAILGQERLGATYSTDEGPLKLFYCQAVVAGAIFCGEYDNITVCTPSQYGKSFIDGHIALELARVGEPVYVAGATADKTAIIMNHVVRAVAESDPSVQAELAKGAKTSIERLTTQLSRDKISFPPKGKKLGGFVDTISLGDAYADKSKSQAVGRAGITFVEEAAMCSEEALAETGRREFAKIDGTAYMRIMISNPHRPGIFYDYLTREARPRDFVLWIDALTAMEEERFTYDQIINSDNAKYRPLLKSYLLCELDDEGMNNFAEPSFYDKEPENATYYMGVDAAYKGKDAVSICLGAVSDCVMVADIYNINVQGDEWIDGVTSEKIINDISRLVGYYHVRKVAIDIGQGIWLKEGLSKRAVNVLPVNFAESPTKELANAGVYASKMAERKRDELHLHLQSLMDDHSIKWTKKTWDMVRDAIPHIKMEMRHNGKIRVEPKSAIKAIIGRSPDELDAVMLMIQAVVTDGINYKEHII